MQAHYLSWLTHNESIYYSVIVDATLDVSHTEQISFVLQYVHGNEENVWGCYIIVQVTWQVKIFFQYFQ